MMIYLADHSDTKQPVKLKTIAEAQSLPFKYLEQLVVSLKNAGLIKSVQGKQGGYLLARPADKIFALDILEASMGPIELLRCIVPDATDCRFKEMCASRRMWGLIEARITDILGEYTLSDLSEKRMLERFTEETGEEAVKLSCDE